MEEKALTYKSSTFLIGVGALFDGAALASGAGDLKYFFVVSAITGAASLVYYGIDKFGKRCESNLYEDKIYDKEDIRSELNG